MSYNGIILRKSISISKIYSIHYFEYMSDFSFEGESHDFWEFLCVDKGEVIVTADTERSVLRHGEITFHQPNEFHNVRKFPVTFISLTGCVNLPFSMRNPSIP